MCFGLVSFFWRVGLEGGLLFIFHQIKSVSRRGDADSFTLPRLFKVKVEVKERCYQQEGKNRHESIVFFFLRDESVVIC